jgi:1,4-dihydroxy-2-naphthoate octaprenyltransferase
MPDSPGDLKAVYLAARPKTWPASFCPVILGSVLAFKDGPISFFLLSYALLFSLLIQIGTNFANDYFDFIKGADNASRIGPKRAVASGWISPNRMKTLTLGAFALSFLASLPLVHASGPWSLFFVLSSIAFGVLYTGGPRPLGYMGLGEVFVLLYFGPVAMLGSYFIQHHTLTPTLFALSLSPGLLSAAILTANNLRDEESDRASKKNTLVVRFGQNFGRFQYTAFIGLALVLPLIAGFYLQLILLLPAVFLLRKAWSFQTPQEAMPLLAQTALMLLTFTLLFCFETLCL